MMVEEKKIIKPSNNKETEGKLTPKSLQVEAETTLAKLPEPPKHIKSKGLQIKSTIDILLHRKPSKLLTLLLEDTRDWYTSLLARESGQSYVYATNIIKVMKSQDIVFYETKGRRKIIRLTEKGEKIAKALDEIIQLSSGKS